MLLFALAVRCPRCKGGSKASRTSKGDGLRISATEEDGQAESSGPGVDPGPRTEDIDQGRFYFK